MSLWQQLEIERKISLTFCNVYKEIMSPGKIIAFDEKHNYKITQKDINRMNRTIRNLSRVWTRVEIEHVRQRMRHTEAMRERPLSLNEELADGHIQR